VNYTDPTFTALRKKQSAKGGCSKKQKSRKAEKQKDQTQQIHSLASYGIKYKRDAHIMYMRF
jgi:hypothetical protein